MTRAYPHGHPALKKGKPKPTPPPPPTPPRSSDRAYSWDDVRKYRKIDYDEVVKEAIATVKELDTVTRLVGAQRFLADIDAKDPEVGETVRRLFKEAEIGATLIAHGKDLNGRSPGPRCSPG